MKVNPVSIQAYQQVNRRESLAVSSEKTRLSETAGDHLVIDPQENTISSRLAVKAPAGTYASHLTPAENEALELLFGKFRDSSGRFGAGYQEDSALSQPDTRVGRMIDLKA